MSRRIWLERIVAAASEADIRMPWAGARPPARTVETGETATRASA